MTKDKIYKGVYESRNFLFEAFSLTKEGAEKAIRKALKDHTKQYGCEKDWFCEDDIFVAEYKLDTSYRDMSEIKLTK
jgi:hypothetical protein